ncbi:hypothetical protein [Rubellicoccus peritrichatus]|uniref:Uncharacterized protein n=1 Tax=Rubellicoccus peritrichatus TaxID=3080537 RepID=A0AAQ3L7Y4_9BACT|nr:hypothetical protein [Puniceicoccus sp. CR14]WOO40332.1 hypothetical protein RZN69_17065 [Puniceicoccus sp. CR14]
MSINKKILCTVLMAVTSWSIMNARTFIEFKETSDIIAPTVLDSFLGNWQGVDGKELISVVSVTKNGLAKAVVSNPDPISVKKASIEEIAGVIPALLIDIEEEGKVVGQYSLILEDGALVGTFDDVKTGKSLDVIFKPSVLSSKFHS